MTTYEVGIYNHHRATCNKCFQQKDYPRLCPVGARLAQYTKVSWEALNADRAKDK